jgi:hypothetical protein
MLEFRIDIETPADRLLYEGLPLVAPALAELGTGALLIGGLATAAWLAANPVGFPARATRDLDLGIDRKALGITRHRRVVGPLLRGLDFEPGFGGEEFRFVRNTEAGDFVVDLLVAKGASRERPPLVESGISSLAAPGLAYAFARGPVPIRIVLLGEERREVTLETITLDAAFVMKAALVASGERSRADRRITDTADAVMLAAACAADPTAVAALGKNAQRSEVKAALGWIADRFDSPRASIPRRFAQHTGEDDAAEWAVGVARSLSDSVRRSR